MTELETFIATREIILTADPIRARPDQPADRWAPNTGHYVVTLMVPSGRKFSTMFSVGPGLILDWARDANFSPRLGDRRVPWADVADSFRMGQPSTMLASTWFDKALVAYAPQLSEVMSALRDDARALDFSFEEWCDEYGNDDDSRAAERTYRACVEVGRGLRDMLGQSAFRELLELEIDE